MRISFSSKILFHKYTANFARDAHRSSYRYSCKVINDMAQCKSKPECLEKFRKFIRYQTVNIRSAALEFSFIRKDFNRLSEGLRKCLFTGFFRLSVGSRKEKLQEGIFCRPVSNRKKLGVGKCL
jgi:hypothetical protein